MQYFEDYQKYDVVLRNTLNSRLRRPVGSFFCIAPTLRLRLLVGENRCGTAGTLGAVDQLAPGALHGMSLAQRSASRGTRMR